MLKPQQLLKHSKLGVIIAVVSSAVCMAQRPDNPGKGGNNGGKQDTLANSAFVYQDNVDGGLFLTNSDGSQTLRLTRPGRTLGQGATWSPDFDSGTDGHQGWIAFFRQYEPGVIWGDLYIVPSDGSGELAIVRSYTDFTTPPPAGNDYSLSWSPDGSRILYEAGDGFLWVVNVVTGETQNLGLVGDTPTFSPDLDATASGYQGRIAYRPDSNDLAVISVEIDDSDALVVDKSGTSFMNITNTPDINETHPVWSPDGQTIAYSRRIAGADIGLDDPGISIIGVETGASMQVVDTLQTQLRPTWSPDGLFVAYHDAREVKGKWTADVFYISAWFPDTPVNVTNTDSQRDIEYDPQWNPSWVNDLP